ncbi:MAG: DUF362 domain-containing protein [Clostridia bacterium]|nr:DUF362 domain-containing protein [Clostridia bacterium]
MSERVVKAAVKACRTYDSKDVQPAIDALFALCGGIERFVKPGQRVLVKLNLLMKRDPAQATTTHPAVAEAIVRAVQRAGATPVLADSPGGPYTKGMLAGVYEACGMKAVAEKTGCQLNDDFSTTTRYLPEGKAARRLDLIGVLDHVDAVITVGKLKTHGLTTMTGCVKNLYGTVPGTTKVEYHARYQDVRLFSDMLLDICACVKPCFAIVDAVIGMEGEGPSGGRPREIGALIGSENPHAADALAARLIGLSADQVTTLEAAKRRGLLPDFVIVGDPIEPMIIRDFDIPMGLRRGSWVRIMNRLPQAFRPRPVFVHKKCDGCGTCIRACPAKAIVMDARRKPQVDVKRCIRCYCCQELCPKTDIEIRRNPVFSLLR